MACIISLEEDQNTKKVYNIISGNEYTPTNIGEFDINPPPSINKNINKGLHFNGASIPQWVFISDEPLTSYNELTISFWFYIEAYRNMNLTSITHGSGYNCEGICITDQNINFINNPVNGNSHYHYPIELNKWYFVEFYYNKSTNINNIFINGNLNYSETIVLDLDYNYIMVGNFSWSPNYYINQLYGYIYDYKVYNNKVHTVNYNIYGYKVYENYYTYGI